MRGFFLFTVTVSLLFSFLITPVANANWGGTIPTGGTGCDEGRFNTCSDPQATCEPHAPSDGSGDPVDTCVIDPSPNRDICQGYDPNDPTHTQQTGICYYSDNDQLPSCGDITAVDYHKNKNYHHISEDIMRCNPNIGHPEQCCAPDAQPSPSFPPPPCTSGKDKTICASVDTGLGTIQVDPGSLVANIFGVLLSLSGGIAIVIIIFSGYRIMFAQGDPEKLQEARQRITSAIIGLLFIIFSVVILRVIGVDILHLPGLNP